MAACFARAGRSRRLQSMASLAAQRVRARGPRLLDGPLLLRGTRQNIAELIGWLWLAVELVRLLRRRRP
jgi:hypothetical protein